MPSYATYEPGQLTARQRRMFRQDPEQLRALLPLKQYLFLLHQAGTTGWMPKLNEFGRPIPLKAQDAESCMVPIRERVAVLEYLVDKAMPDVKSQETEKKTNADLLAQAPSDARYLTTASLHAAAQDNDHQGEVVHDATPEPSAEELFDVPRVRRPS